MSRSWARSRTAVGIGCWVGRPHPPIDSGSATTTSTPWSMTAPDWPSEVLADEQGPTCADFARRAQTYFASHGIRFQRIMTDHAWGYVRSAAFCSTLAELGRRQLRAPPYTPRVNGKAPLLQPPPRPHRARRPAAHRSRQQSVRTLLLCRRVVRSNASSARPYRLPRHMRCSA
jgi:hypothetical protein